MDVEVLLMEDVADLGAEGEVVKVAAGYARNYLFPHKKAATVTAGMRRRLEKLREQRRQESEARLKQAEALAAELARESHTIAVKVGESEKLFGSVTAADIAGALASAGIEVDRHWIELETPIRELGVYDVTVNIPPSVKTTVKIWVVEE